VKIRIVVIDSSDSSPEFITAMKIESGGICTTYGEGVY
jgi:hypothetical protein